MSSSAGELVNRALLVESPDELDALWDKLAVHARHQRPVGDRWGNRGMFTAAGGTFDHKLVELVTNMHDALVYFEVARRDPSARIDEVRFAGLFSSPREAVEAVFAGWTRTDLAELAAVELRGSGEKATARRDRTIVFRDRGIGMAPDDFPTTLLRVGSSRKDGVLWQMGAFGRGGLTVLPNCYGWVVVSRKQPELLNGAPDSVTITVVRWSLVGNRQTETALYQVTSPWRNDGDVALPFHFPASQADDFPPGTHVAVVGFHAEGIWVSRLGDERSLDTLIDTRLFDSALPVALSTPALESRASRQTVLRGLASRLRDNPRPDRTEGAEELPFIFESQTYRLPIRYFLFPSGDAGARRRYVAKDHALILDSNGQVHAHWTPVEFRQRTRLPKLADRILVVVDTDTLPLSLRTRLFTADRTELLRNTEAVRLEQELTSFLNDWDELWRMNNELVRDAIRRSNVDRSTVALGQKIARALDLKLQRPPRQDDVRSSRGTTPSSVLLVDPTSLGGPEEVVAVRGRTKGVYFALNAQDGFLPRRCSVVTRCSHLDIDPDTDLTVGELRGGRFRVAVAVPPDADLCTASLTVEIDGWLSSSGGSGPSLTKSVKFTVVDAEEPSSTAFGEPGASASTDRRGAEKSTGPTATVALLWTSHEREPDWDARTVGEIETIEADSLASVDEQYAFLAGQHHDVPVLKLNEEFSPLKAYAAHRARSVGDEGVARAKDRYAVGVGVQMLLMERVLLSARDTDQTPSDETLRQMRAAAARGVLSMLPDFDQLLGEAGLEDL